MATFLSLELLISTVFVLLVPLGFYLFSRSSCSRSKSPTLLPTNWPILHMFPSMIANLHNLHDYLTVVLAGSGHNFRAHGPPGTGMRFFITCEPANARHIFTTNYTNFPKGKQLTDIFDILAVSLFTSDGEPSRRLRAKAHGFLTNPRLVAHTATCCRDKVEKGLLPFFTHMAITGTPFNLQEVFSSFMFDLAAKLTFGVEPDLISNRPPMNTVDALAAMNMVMEVGFFRMTTPAFVWKVLRWLNIGPERKLGEANRVLRRFVVEMMEMWKIKRVHVANQEAKECVDFLSYSIEDPDYADKNLLHVNLMGSMLAARDTIATTLPWTFYNLAQNPDIVSIIRNELSPIALRKLPGMVIFEPQETKSLVFLTAVLYETLRLYPPVPFESKMVAANDIMPSGHKVSAGDTILISIHSMGRMESVWGKDCLDYNPSRWLSKDGKTLKHVPSHKFLAFNSGPRSCVGKDIAIMQMKTIVAAAVWNFDMDMVEGQSIQPKPSCLLSLKNGLIVKLKKREM